MTREVKLARETIEKIMSLWEKSGKKNFTVRVPQSHRVKEFEVLLKQMLVHYGVPVKVGMEEIPIEIKCNCGYNGAVKVHNPLAGTSNVTCPICKGNRTKVISGNGIEVV